MSSLIRGRFQISLASWVVLLLSSARIPLAASEEIIDCRNVSGYTSGPVPDTCTVQLTLNDTEAEIISSLKDKYEDFPLKCRLRKYTSYVYRKQLLRSLKRSKM